MPELHTPERGATESVRDYKVRRKAHQLFVKRLKHPEKWANGRVPKPSEAKTARRTKQFLMGGLSAKKARRSAAFGTVVGARVSDTVNAY